MILSVFSDYDMLDLTPYHIDLYEIFTPVMVLINFVVFIVRVVVWVTAVYCSTHGTFNWRNEF